MNNLFENVPAVNAVLACAEVQLLLKEYPKSQVVQGIRNQLDLLRERLKNQEPIVPATDSKSSFLVKIVIDGLRNELLQLGKYRFRKVLNATGVILHTNLGRAPLAKVAAAQATQAAQGYLNLELDLETGKRSSRQEFIHDILTHLTGAEAATVVNNCAAATIIVLRALAAGKEVIVSRGQLIEIGGSFRIPEIMKVSGAILREVGTTNIVRIGDYAEAIQAQTGILMRIHTSNYRVHGFTKEVKLSELVGLGAKHQIPVVDDVGSGMMIPIERFGLSGEPCVIDSIKQGADLVLFSGDKLLGGPQAGIILGKKKWIQKIEKDPLMRALRLDKMTLTALESTLKIYLDPEQAIQEIPTLRMISMRSELLRERSETICLHLRQLSAVQSAEVCPSLAYVGGGTLPDQAISSLAIVLRLQNIPPETLSKKLRLAEPAIMTRIENESILLDLRTIPPDEDLILIDVLVKVLASESLPMNSD